MNYPAQYVHNSHCRWNIRVPTGYVRIYLSSCLAIYLSVWLCLCLCLCLSVYLYIYLSAYLSVCMYVCLYISIYMSVCLSVVCLYVDEFVIAISLQFNLLSAAEYVTAYFCMLRRIFAETRVLNRLYITVD